MSDRSPKAAKVRTPAPAGSRGIARRDIGAAAEQAALDHLEARGLRTITRNFRCKGGEIDLVMADGEQLVFVEVRYRSNPAFGRAEETVNRRKQARLLLAARLYLSNTADRRPARFDVVAIHPHGKTLDLTWIRDAFTA